MGVERRKHSDRAVGKGSVEEAAVSGLAEDVFGMTGGE